MRPRRDKGGCQVNKPSFMLAFACWVSVIALLWMFVLGIVQFTPFNGIVWAFFLFWALVSSAYVSADRSPRRTTAVGDNDIVWKSERTKRTKEKTVRNTPEP